MPKRKGGKKVDKPIIIQRFLVITKMPQGYSSLLLKLSLLAMMTMVIDVQEMP